MRSRATIRPKSPVKIRILSSNLQCKTPDEPAATRFPGKNRDMALHSKTRNPKPQTFFSEPGTPNSELFILSAATITGGLALHSKTRNPKPQTFFSEPGTPNSELFILSAATITGGFHKPNFKLQTPNPKLFSRNPELRTRNSKLPFLSPAPAPGSAPPTLRRGSRP
jgi:hypothetical protein